MSIVKVGTVDELNVVRLRLKIVSLAIEGLGGRHGIPNEADELADMVMMECLKLSEISKAIWPDKKAA